MLSFWYWGANAIALQWDTPDDTKIIDKNVTLEEDMSGLARRGRRMRQLSDIIVDIDGGFTVSNACI